MALFFITNVAFAFEFLFPLAFFLEVILVVVVGPSFLILRESR